MATVLDRPYDVYLGFLSFFIISIITCMSSLSPSVNCSVLVDSEISEGYKVEPVSLHFVCVYKS